MVLSIIIVSYNTKDLLKDCLLSIIKNTNQVSYEIIVSDNNSSDGTPKMVRDVFPNVKLIENKFNLGFSKANNQGYKLSKGEVLLFLNPDTIVLDSAVAKILNYFKKNIDVGAVGPKILDNNFQPICSYKRFLDIKKVFLGTKYFKYIFDIEKYRLDYKHYDFNSIKTVEWISGACIALKRELFERVGCWDENYFLYCEDMDLCYQITQIGYKIVFNPKAVIIHHVGQSAKVMGHPVQKSHTKSIKYYFRKNHPFSHYMIVTIFLKIISLIKNK